MAYMRDSEGTRLDSIPVLSKADAAGKYAPRLGIRTAASAFRGSSKIRAMASRPPYDAPVMTTPPTITLSATQGTGLSKLVAYDSPAYRWSGPLSGGNGFPRGYTKIDGTIAQSAVSTQVAFDFDGAAFDFVIKPTSATRFRVWVNEQAHAANLPLIGGTNAWVYLNVNLGSTSVGAPRRIVIEIEDSASPIMTSGVRINPIATVLPPTIASPRVMIVGDSYGQGIGADFFANGYSRTLGRLMGWADCWSEFTSIPSTGLVKDNSATIGRYITRLAGDVIPYSPDLVIVQGSLNDNPYVGQNLIGPALIDYVTTLRAALPNCMVIATSPLYVADPPASYIGVRDEMATAAAVLGVPFIDLLNPVIFSGTGKLGTTTGNGNADVYRNSDGTHATKEAHYLIAKVIAGRLAAILGQYE